MVRNMKWKPGKDLLMNSQADEVTNTINVPDYLSQIIIVSWKNTETLVIIFPFMTTNWNHRKEKASSILRKWGAEILTVGYNGRYTKGK